MQRTKTGLRYFKKGSPEAKRHMAKLRAMAQKKRKNPSVASSLIGGAAGAALASVLGNPEKKKSKYASICQRCVWRTHPLMLTTYSIRGQKCDMCGYVSDLALVDTSQKMKNPPRAHAGAEKLLDKQIEQAYYRHAQRVQVSVMDIPKIFRDVKLELAAGVDLDPAVISVVRKYQSPGGRQINPKSRRNPSPSAAWERMTDQQRAWTLRISGLPIEMAGEYAALSWSTLPEKVKSTVTRQWQTNPGGPQFIVIDSETGHVMYTKRATGMGSEAINACVAKARQLAARNNRSYIVFLDLSRQRIGGQMNVQMVRHMGITDEIHPGRNPASRRTQAFMSREISHLMRDKGYPQKRAVAAAYSVARKKGYKVNPLTRAEAADTLRSAKHDLKAAKTGELGEGYARTIIAPKARRFYAGRAAGKAWAAKVHGPARTGAEVAFRRGARIGLRNWGRRPIPPRLSGAQASKVRARFERKLKEMCRNPVCSNPRHGHRVMRRNPLLQIVGLANPPKSAEKLFNGRTTSVKEALEFARRTGNKSLLAQCQAALRLCKDANKEALRVRWDKLSVGDPSKLEMVAAVTEYGETDETVYKPPAGSKKGKHLYRHDWGDGTGRRKPVPLLAAPSGKALIMPLRSGQKAGDWLRG